MALGNSCHHQQALTTVHPKRGTAGGAWLPWKEGQVPGTLTFAPAGDKIDGLSQGTETWEELPIFFIEVPTGFFSWTLQCLEVEDTGAGRLPPGSQKLTAAGQPRSLREGQECWTLA